jgi:lysophospholipase L1-like esterase
MDNILLNAMTPLWLGTTVHNESLMFIPEQDTGEVLPAQLLYDPIDIVSVRSSDNTAEYQEGYDYTLESGCLKRTDSGRIPCFQRDQFYLKEPAAIAIESVRFPGRYVRYEQGGVGFARHQVSVTYRHSCQWQGPVIQFNLRHLPGTMARLLDKQPVRMLFYGDSVMEGCDSTGHSEIAPYLPSSDKLLVQWLARQYHHPLIQQINTAVGGTDSAWGSVHADERLAAYRPDLAVIGFGMNDGSRRLMAAEYRQNIINIMETARKQKPETEFLLLSPGLPNPDCKGWTGLQEEYAPALEQIARQFPGCAHVAITAIHRYLYTKKRYDDMSGNGINHPNDFLARVNAQAMAACLLQE